MSRGVNQAADLRIEAEDRKAVGRHGAEAGPGAPDGLGEERREQHAGLGTDVADPFGGGRLLEPGVLHGAAEQGVVAAGDDVGAATEQNAFGLAGGPWHERHLSAHRLDGKGAGEAADGGRPGACGEDDGPGVVTRARRAHPRHASAFHAQVGDLLVLQDLGAAAGGVGEEPGREGDVVHDPVAGGEEGASGLVADAGVARLECVPVQPLGIEAGRALGFDLCHKLGDARVIERDENDAAMEEAHARLPVALQFRDQTGVAVPRGEGEREQGITGGGFDLRGQHAGRGRGGFCARRAPVHDDHRPAGRGHGAGGGGAHEAGPYYDAVGHLAVPADVERN